MRTRIPARAIGLGLVTSVALFLTGCQSVPVAASSDATIESDGTTLDRTSTSPIDGSTAVLLVHGLGCPLCAHNVDEQLAAIDGVKDVEVDLGTGNITVALMGTPHPTPAQLAAAVERSGFTLVRISAP